MTVQTPNKDESQNNPNPVDSAKSPQEKLYGKEQEVEKAEGESQEEGTKQQTEEAPEAANGEEEEATEIKLTLPENSLLTEADIERVQALAKEENLTQEQAEKRLMADHELVLKALTDENVLNTQVAKAREVWKKAALQDKEIGGQKISESIRFAKTAIDKLGTPALKEALEKFGYGDSPEFIRFASKVGRLLSDDSIERGQAKPTPQHVRPADKMYSKTN